MSIYTIEVNIRAFSDEAITKEFWARELFDIDELDDDDIFDEFTNRRLQSQTDIADASIIARLEELYYRKIKGQNIDAEINDILADSANHII